MEIPRGLLTITNRYYVGIDTISKLVFWNRQVNKLDTCHIVYIMQQKKPTKLHSIDRLKLPWLTASIANATRHAINACKQTCKKTNEHAITGKKKAKTKNVECLLLTQRQRSERVLNTVLSDVGIQSSLIKSKRRPKCRHINLI